MRRHGWLVLLGIVFLTGCGKEKKPTSGWASFPVAIYTDPRVVATNEDFQDLQVAMAFWESNAGVDFFDYRGNWNGGQPFVGNPQNPTGISANVIFFLEPWSFSPSTAGMTTILSSENGNQGSIIMLNPNLVLCNGECKEENQKTSRQKLLAHELGHFIGLPHIDDPSNIMNPSLQPGGSLSQVGINSVHLGQVLNRE